MVFAFALTSGSLIVAIFLVVIVASVAYGLYPRRGSAINKHPFHGAYSGAPGTRRPDEFSDFETFEEQYVGRRHAPADSDEAESSQPKD